MRPSSGTSPKRRRRLLKLEQGGVDLGGSEVGPEGRGEEVLGVRRLPYKEVGDAAFAARTDQQVRIGQAGGREPRRDRFVRDPFGPHPLGDQRAHGVHDVGAAAVVERHVHVNAAVWRRALNGGEHGAAQAGRQSVEVADVAQADAFVVERIEVPRDELAR